jgi:hypothetical protein
LFGQTKQIDVMTSKELILSTNLSEIQNTNTNVIILPTARDLLRSQVVGSISEKALKQVNNSLRFEVPLNSTVDNSKPVLSLGPVVILAQNSTKPESLTPTKLNRHQK